MKVVMSIGFLFLILHAALIGDEKEKQVSIEYRIISLDNSATEILFKLDLGKRIVGRDSTSKYPTDALQIKSVGDHGKLNNEAILNLKPTHIIINDAVKSDQVSQISNLANVVVITLSSTPSNQTAIEKINKLSEVFNKKTEGSELNKKIAKDLESLELKKNALKPQPLKVMCVYLRGKNTMFILGEDSGPVGVCKTVGVNLCFPDLQAPKPLNTEALLVANPEVYIVFSSGLETVGGLEGFLEIPGVSSTKGGLNKKIISVDGSLLNTFGPRVGEAANKLFTAIYETKGFVEIK
jgi:iron complex transport system substrate-binding protein